MTEPGITLADNTAFNDLGSVGLGNKESMIASLLIEGPKTRNELLDAIYNEENGGPLSASQCLTMFIVRMRKKFAPLGMTIMNINRRTRGNSLYALLPASE